MNYDDWKYFSYNPKLTPVGHFSTVRFFLMGCRVVVLGLKDVANRHEPILAATKAFEPARSMVFGNKRPFQTLCAACTYSSLWSEQQSQIQEKAAKFLYFVFVLVIDAKPGMKSS